MVGWWDGGVVEWSGEGVSTPTLAFIRALALALALALAVTRTPSYLDSPLSHPRLGGESGPACPSDDPLLSETVERGALCALRRRIESDC